MEIKINIDESRFKDVLEKELEAFSQEEIKAILEQAMKEYLNREDVLKEFVERTETDSWGSPRKGTSVMDRLVANVDLSDVFAEPKKKIVEIVGKEETLKQTAMELLAGIFRDRYKSAMLGDYEFLTQIASQVEYILTQRRNTC